MVADLAGHVGEDGGEGVDRSGEVGRPLADRRAVVDAARCAVGASPTGAVRIPNAASIGRWSSLSHRRQRASIAAAVSAVSYSTPTSQPSTSRLIVPAHTGRCAWLPQGSGGRGSTNGPPTSIDRAARHPRRWRGRCRRAGPGPRSRPPPPRRRAPSTSAGRPTISASSAAMTAGEVAPSRSNQTAEAEGLSRTTEASRPSKRTTSGSRKTVSMASWGAGRLTPHHRRSRRRRRPQSSSMNESSHDGTVDATDTSWWKLDRASSSSGRWAVSGPSAAAGETRSGGARVVRLAGDHDGGQRRRAGERAEFRRRDRRQPGGGERSPVRPQLGPTTDVEERDRIGDVPPAPTHQRGRQRALARAVPSGEEDGAPVARHRGGPHRDASAIARRASAMRSISATS